MAVSYKKLLHLMIEKDITNAKNMLILLIIRENITIGAVALNNS